MISLSLVHVSPGDTVAARMPDLDEQRAMGIGWIPILAVTRAGGAQELYDSTRYAIVCD